MSMVLQCKETADFKPHPEGIHPAVCVDVMDMGLVETEFQGQRRMVNKVKLVFESEQKIEDGRNCTVSKNFTASLHQKAKLAEFLGKWRGRPIVPGETVDMGKLIGACCTLVISHQQNMVGRTYASIDAVSKPTKRVAPSGHYDPVLVRQRFSEWKARQQVAAAPAHVPTPAAATMRTSPQPPMQAAPATPTEEADWTRGGASLPAQPVPKSVAPTISAPATPDYDPEVGF
jgi:hypothetical protein